MAAESQVGCFNYELKNTSNQSLDCASSSNVKAQKLQLGRAIIVKIIARFLSQQVHSLRFGMSFGVSFSKTESRRKLMRTDQRRNEDLTRLKSVGGLFVCAAELTYIVIHLARTNIAFNEVHTTFYEVSYAHDTCLSTPYCSEIFQLKPLFEL